MNQQDREALARQYPRLNIDRVLEAWEIIQASNQDADLHEFLKRADAIVAEAPKHGWAR